MKIRFTPSARAQFLSALTFIRRDKPSAPSRFRDRTDTVLRRLEDFPESGRVVPEFSDLPYRGDNCITISVLLNSEEV